MRLSSRVRNTLTKFILLGAIVYFGMAVQVTVAQDNITGKPQTSLIYEAEKSLADLGYWITKADDKKDASTYHAIVACVAAGTGIALVPESVLDTVVHDAISRYPIPKVYGSVTTPFIWRRDGGHSAVVGALCELLRARTAPSAKRPKLSLDSASNA